MNLILEHPRTHVQVLLRDDRVQTFSRLGKGCARLFAYMRENHRQIWTAQEELGLLLKRGWKAPTKEKA